MKKKLKFVLIGVLILSAINLALVLRRDFLLNDHNRIYNKNKVIAEHTNDCSINGEVEKETIDNTLNIKINLKGAYRIGKYDALEDETLTVICDTKSSEGKFKVVLITPDNKVITLLEHENDQVDCLVSEIKILKGENRIKLIGKDNAYIDLSIDISNREFWKNNY
ncbi:hypothetical protein [Oceanirhabdus sp. W0125-5]|uniref:hypothetical protein n=1 Tax=Oceanirhabdus sp. W0125-5 TaxID=2999116 RepID=UPI0022F2C8A3|nr:hypothetical protein [Oceanirhabdus sp. W0125-5]WBW99174.1 hypothetical protein OW730_10625 [Oceanirhabdus sp. W0125-5]